MAFCKAESCHYLFRVTDKSSFPASNQAYVKKQLMLCE